MKVRSENAIKILLGLTIAVIVFHVFIVLKIIPYQIAWGGRLQNDTEMYIFELGSAAINLFFFLILLMKGNYLKLRFPSKAINLALWIFLTIFALNTIGNLFAKTSVEKYFSLLTLLFSSLIWIILRDKNLLNSESRYENTLIEKKEI